MTVLSAEDVLNKAFSKTLYREGFDQDEVDDFLDEVAHTIQVLIAERDDLAARLQQAPQAGAAATAPAPTEPAPTEAPATTGSTATMLAMAQKLHDEYVSSGQEERQRLIDEGEAKAQDIIDQARQEAQSVAAAATQQADRSRADLERKIDDLRRFERDYRARLKAYLENVLGDLDHSSATGTTPSADFHV